MRPAPPAPPPSLAPYIDSNPGVQSGPPSSSSVHVNGSADGSGPRAVAMASFSGSHENIPEQDRKSRNRDPSLLSATALTLQSSCRCPHLDAVLPHILRLDRYDPIVELHLGSHFGDVVPAAVNAAGSSSSARAASLAASATTASASASKASSNSSRDHNHHRNDNHHHKAKEGEASISTATDAPSLKISSSIKSPSSSVPASPAPPLNTATIAGTTSTSPVTTAVAAKLPSAPSNKKTSHLPPNAATTAVTSKSQRADRAVFGPEHARLLAVTGRGGAATSWCPVLPPLYQPSGSLGKSTYGGSGSGDGSDRNGGDKRKKKSGKKRKAAVVGGGAVAAKVGMEETKSAYDEAQPAAAVTAAVTAAISAVNLPLANAESDGASAAAAPVVSQTGAIPSSDTATAPAAATAPTAVKAGTETKISADPCTASSELKGVPPSTSTDTVSQSGETNRTSSEKKKVSSALDTAAVTTTSGTSSAVEPSGIKDPSDLSQEKDPKENCGNSEAATNDDSLSRPENVSSTGASAESPPSMKIDEQEDTTSDSIIKRSKNDTKEKHDVPDVSSEDATAASDAENKTVTQESSPATVLEAETSEAKDIEGSISDAPLMKSETAEPMDIDNEDTSKSLNPPQGEALSLPSTDNPVQATAREGTRIPSAEKTETKDDVIAGDSVSKDGEDESSQDVSPTAVAAQDAPKSVDANGTNPTTKDVLPDTHCNLSDSRYSQLRSRERRLIRERENVLLKSREMPSPDDICLPSTSQQKQTHRQTKREEDDTVAKASTNCLTTSTAIHVVSDDEFSFERRMLRSGASMASSKVEGWLEVIRGGREARFDGERVKHARRPCAWCPRPCNKTEFNKNRHPTGDELMQCLECSVVGCGPSSTCSDSSMHMMCHFIASGHQFGITCGPRAEIFCAKCGDFVYHEVFDQEKERIEIAQFVPQYGWDADHLRRSYEPLSFVSTPDHGIIWRGMMATYPVPVPLELVAAGRLGLKRILMFSGEMEAGGGSATWGPLALRLAISQSRLGTACCKIKAPIGLYNLGNTCFMSSVLQCLVNCSPIQRYFLRNVRHNHKSCEALRAVHGTAPSSPRKSNRGGQEKNAGICIACEMDRLLLDYFGRTIGHDVVAALEEGPSLSSSCVSSAADAVSSRKCGEPLVPARLLAATWKSGGMQHLAGYQQRDAHEFLSAFLDSMGKHDRHFSNIIVKMRDEARASSIPQQDMERNSRSIGSDNIVSYLFAGNLRSVLICMTCGCKRSQPEPFLDVSLPITPETKTIESCIQNFTRPEELSDSVLCPSCAIKTATRKQHTFAKLPKILCLHLKRFDAATNRKISDFVSFPAHGLNLGAFLPHWCEVVEGMKGPNAVPNEGDAASPQILYDLYATVNHTGSLHQGHYVSNVKVNAKWYHCNDAYVCDAGEGDGEKAVLEADGAYMLFYMRRDIGTGSSSRS